MVAADRMIERARRGIPSGRVKRGESEGLPDSLFRTPRVSASLPPSLAGQEAELEHRGQFPQPVLPWCEVNVFRCLGRMQGEILQHRSEEEEEL